MKLSPEKCRLLVLRQRSDIPFTVRIGDIEVVNSSDEKLFGIQIDIKLSFDKHITICAKKLVINCMHLLAYPHISMK